MSDTSKRRIAKLQKENIALREQLAQLRAVVNIMADRYGRPEFKTRLFDDFLLMIRCHRRAHSEAKQ